MMPRGRRQLVVLALLIVAAASLSLSPAHAAEPDVIATDPAARARTDVPPPRVTIAFTDNVRQDDATIVVKNSAGDIVSGGSFVIEGNNIYVDLDYAVPRGTYTVQYRATTTGGVPFGGSYQFAHGNGSFDDAAFATWSGADAIPEDVRLPGDPAAPAPDASASPSPGSGDASEDAESTDGGDDADSAGSGDASSATGTSAERDDASGTFAAAWWWMPALVVLLAAAAAALWYRARRTGAAASPETDD